MLKNKLKIIFGIIFVAGLTLFSYQDTQAARKESVFELDAYKNYSITVTFKDSNIGEDCKVFVKTPDGETYKCIETTDGSYSTTVSSKEKGEWKIVAKNKSDYIPQYKASITVAKDNATTVIDNDIKIGKDIVGLSVWFKNSDLQVSWTDTTINSVNVKILNLDNDEVLANSQIQNNYGTFPIKEGVSKIMVSVVPTESTTVKGSAKTMELDVPSFPKDCDIIFNENKKYVNTDYIGIEVITDDDYGIKVEDNGIVTYETDTVNAGEYKIEPPASEDGLHQISCYLIDSKGNMLSKDYEYLLDTIAPVITMSKEYDNASTDLSEVEIEGTVSGQDVLFINGMEVYPASDGTFIYSISLHKGLNAVNIEAYDEAENVSRVNLNILMEEKASNDVNVSFIIIVILAVVVIVLLLLRRNKKKDKVSLSDDNVSVINNPDDAVTANNTEDTIADNNSGNDNMKDRLNKKLSFLKRGNKKNATENDAVEDETKQEKITKQESIVIEKPENKPLHNNKLSKKDIYGKKKINIRNYIEILIVAVVSFLVFKEIFVPCQVPSGSMEPTIMTGDHFIMFKPAYMFEKIQRGDIVNFYSYEEECYMVKRVIGLPGDEIKFHDGYVYINGSLLDESDYLDVDLETDCLKTFNVPDKCYFMMGDNRDNSSDSRFWDQPYVAESDIQGRAVLKIGLSGGLSLDILDRQSYINNINA